MSKTNLQPHAYKPLVGTVRCAVCDSPRLALIHALQQARDNPFLAPQDITPWEPSRDDSDLHPHEPRPWEPGSAEAIYREGWAAGADFNGDFSDAEGAAAAVDDAWAESAAREAASIRSPEAVAAAAETIPGNLPSGEFSEWVYFPGGRSRAGRLLAEVERLLARLRVVNEAAEAAEGEAERLRAENDELRRQEGELLAEAERLRVENSLLMAERGVRLPDAS